MAAAARPRPPPRADAPALSGSGRVPLRSCVGCRRKAPKSELVRVAVDAEGRVRLGEGSGGRGAWLCVGSTACLERALRRRAFDRALRRGLRPEQLRELAELLGRGVPAGGRQAFKAPAFEGGAAVWEDRGDVDRDG